MAESRLILLPTRYSAVPWLADGDLRPAASDGWCVIDDGDEIAHQMAIRGPFGKDTDTFLTVHAFRTGEILMSEGMVEPGPPLAQPAACVEDDAA